MIDYKVMEAVHVKVMQEDTEAREKAERAAKQKQWKDDKTELMKHAG